MTYMVKAMSCFDSSFSYYEREKVNVTKNSKPT